MKNKGKHILTFLAAGVMTVAIGVLTGIMPQSTAYAASTVTVSVADFGADGSDNKDDTAAFQEAFDLAQNSDDLVKITIPKGTYYVSDRIYVYSNTYVTATGATIIANIDNGAMLVGAHTDSDGKFCSGNTCTAHGGYTQISNITIKGGTWDRNSKATQNSIGMMFVHGKNITIQNATCKNATNHIINVSGCKNVKILNCTIKDAIKYTGKDADFWGDSSYGDESRYLSIEAVHLDFMTAVGEAASLPNDGTPVSNVTISGCKFSNVFSGIGTHHITNKKATDIYIEDNTFTNLSYAGVLGASFKNLNITGNTFKSTKSNTKSMLVLIRASQATIKDNVITNVYKGIQLMSASEAVIEGNTISGTTENGINVRDKSTATISNNELSNNKGRAIRIFGSSTGTIDGNTITSAGSYAVLVTGATGAEVTNNVIKKPKEYGVFISASDDTLVSGNKVTSPGKAAVIVDKASVARIEKNTITSPGVQGIYVRAKSSVVISANTISDSAGMGITVNSKSAFKIYGNTIKNSSKYAVYIDGCIGTIKSNTIDTAGTGIVIRNNLSVSGALTKYAYKLSDGTKTTFVNDNKIKNITGNSVYIGGSARAYVLANTINKAGKIGICVYDKSNTILKNNTISNITGNGIAVSEKSTAVISGNKLSAIKSGGIRASEANYVSIANNTISSASKIGIYVNAYKKSYITNNTVVSGGHGIYVEGGTDHKTKAVISGNKSKPTGASSYAIRITSTSSGCVIEKNTMGGRGLSADKGTSYTASKNVKVSK